METVDDCFNSHSAIPFDQAQYTADHLFSDFRGFNPSFAQTKKTMQLTFEISFWFINQGVVSWPHSFNFGVEDVICSEVVFLHSDCRWHQMLTGLIVLALILRCFKSKPSYFSFFSTLSVLLVKRMEIIFFIAFSSETQSLVGKACQGFRQRTKRYLVVRFIKRNWRTWLVPFLERRLGCPIEVLILRWH